MNKPCVLIICLFSGVAAAQTGIDSNELLEEISVEARRVANEWPASTYATAATELRFDPLTELQSRGIAEGQSDVTVRGGLFENTGFKLGAVTVMDPQTGHYVAELPVDPAFMSGPEIVKGIDNALIGFNSAIATVAYNLDAVEPGGSFSAGIGSDSLNFQSLRAAAQLAAGTAIGASYARSEGDGSVENGDHSFERANVVLQRRSADVQTDVLFAYQDKFFGWPGAYTGFATFAETDDTQTTLVLANQYREFDRGYFEIGGFWRQLVDDYDFDRTTIDAGGAGSFEHETRTSGIGFEGALSRGRVDWEYAGQFTTDELVRSTDLVGGEFRKRRYLTVAIVPSIELTSTTESEVLLRAGFKYDQSDRDRDRVSPQLGVTWSAAMGRARNEVTLEYSANSQVPGYTALNSRPAGLFGGNPDLDRERADTLSLAYTRNEADWMVRAVVFYREDDDLVDWTYATGAPFARQANAVDIDVTGIELLWQRSWTNVDLAAGFLHLDKDADYGTAAVDASFYALNFARDRATLALIWRIAPGFELRLDNEYRSQKENPLRVGDDSVYLASAALNWSPEMTRGLRLALTADNLTDSEYQPFPGTPASGRQVSLHLGYDW